MKENISWETLARYFAGELIGEEKQTFEMWIDAEPDRKEQIEKLHKIWKESSLLPYQLDVDEAWKALEGNLDRFEKTPQTVNQSDSVNKKQLRIVSLPKSSENPAKTGSAGRRLAMLAASVLIMLTAGFLTHHYHLGVQEAAKTKDLAREELTTRDGERAVYTLNDGSRVILHAGSRLGVPVNFNTQNRELFLEGEAYFDVEHNPDNPFVVRSGEAYTRVLGTKFLVQAWPDKGKDVEVIVEEGSVALGESLGMSSAVQQQEVIITHNQRGVLTTGTPPTVRNITDLHWYLGWTEGRLVFEDRQLSEILPRLERWYAVEIHTEESTIDQMKLTAEIDYNQPMMEVLTGIALSLELEIEKEGRILIFRLAD